MTGLIDHLPMMTQRTCGKCGAPVRAVGPDKLCLNCLLDSAIEPDSSLEITSESNASAKPDSTGTTRTLFGDYELMEELGRGGMGVVYKARQGSLNRVVAIKMLPFGTLAAPQFIKRFMAEAAAAASLQHPNIIAIHEVGAREGQYFFVMDYIDGQSLAHLASTEPLSTTQAARYLKTLAEAIGYAHDRGIIHRDLKPSNILIESATNRLRITDFGLARRIDGESTLTVTGQVLGSPHFMAPEQAAGTEAGKAADIYALGGILFFLLTSRAPFQGVSLEAILQQVLSSEPISPRLLNPAVPRDLETICLKCLQKEPENRYATAQELAAELGRCLADEPIQARPASPFEKMLRWRRRKPVLAASLLVTLALALIVLLGSPIAAYRINQARKNAVDQGNQARNEARRAEASEFAARQSAYAADINLAGMALEENNLARARELLDRYLSGSGKQKDLRGWEWRYLRGRSRSDEFATLKSRSENSKWILSVAFSPDGAFLAAASQDGKVTLWSVKDRRKIGELLHQGAVRSIAFSPQGGSLATAAVDGLMRIWELRTFQTVWQAPADIEMLAGSVAFSPDGTLLARGGSSGDVLVSNMVSKIEFKLETGEWGITEIAFAPDGRSLATRNNQGSLRVWDVATRKVKHVLPHGGWGESSIAFSVDGTILASTGPDRVLNLWRMDTGKLLKSATNRFGFPTGAVFSPDGKILAVANSEHTITLRDVETWSSLAELKGHLAPVSSIAYSHDGTLLATGSDDGEVKLWSPSAPPQDAQTLSLPANTKGAFAPDFRKFVLLGPNQRIEVVDSSSLTKLRSFSVSETNVTSIGLSPDGIFLGLGTKSGKVVVYQTEDDNLGIRLEFDAREEIRGIAFSGDGEKLAVCGSQTIHLWGLSSKSELFRLKHFDGDWGVENEQNLTRFFERSRTIRFSPDGKLLACSARNGVVKLWNLAGSPNPRELRAHDDYITDLAIFDQSRKLATSSWDRTVKIWDTATLRLLVVLQGSVGDPTAVSGTADGSRIVVAASDGTIALWIPDRHHPVQVAALRSRSPSLAAVGFLPEGNEIAAASLDEVVLRRAPALDQIDIAAKRVMTPID